MIGDQEFIARLERTQLFGRLLQATPFSSRELIVLLFTAPDRYKEHTIKKRNNRGFRLISQPTAELKLMQRYLIANDLSTIPIHACATAYMKGKSIADHAKLHSKNKYLLKLDFQNFFPSISDETLKLRLSQDLRFSDEELWAIINLLCKKDRSTGKLSLSIGAPSSPKLSNYIMFEFDQLLGNYCKDNDVIYTRYADDLAFSTSHPNILESTYTYVKSLLIELKYLNLRLNAEKTVNVSRKNKRSLVGLVLSNDGNVSIGRDGKRKLKSMMHHYSLGDLSAIETNRLKGNLAFLLSIDKEFVTSLCRKFNISRVADINPVKIENLAIAVGSNENNSDDSVPF